MKIKNLYFRMLLAAAVLLTAFLCTACGSVKECVVHEWDEFSVVVAAGCETEGLCERVCVKCGEKESRSLPPEGHSEVIDEAAGASCTEAGLTAGSHCGKCGKILSQQFVIPELGHTEREEGGREATCTESGMTAETKCGRCGMVLEAAEEIAALGHDYSEYEYNGDATCLQDGTMTAVCRRCGDEKTETVKNTALGHTEREEGGREATCTESGMTAETKCGRCGMVLEAAEEIAALGHDYSEYEYNGDATCLQDGTMTAVCRRCGDEKTETVKNTALGHAEREEGGREATCTESGMTAETKCRRCGMVLEAAEEIAALGHKYIDTKTEAGCFTGGFTLHKCLRCGDEYKTDETPAAHTWDIKEPTCGRGQLCLKCGTPGLAATELHTMKDGTCSVCGYVCPHDYKISVVLPTCTLPGYDLYSCLLCGCEKNENTVPALGHDGGIICGKCGLRTVKDGFFAEFAAGISKTPFTLKSQSFAVNIAGTEYQSVKIKELCIYSDRNGELAGHFTCSYAVEHEFYTENVTLCAVINNGFVKYRYSSDGIASGVSLGGNAAEENAFPEDVTGSVSLSDFMISGETAPQIKNMLGAVRFYYTALKPIFGYFAVNEPQKTDKFLTGVFSRIFSVSSDDGITLSLSAELTAALLDDWKELTAAEIFDAILGEGGYMYITDLLAGCVSSTIESMMDKATDKEAQARFIAALAECVYYAAAGKTEPWFDGAEGASLMHEILDGVYDEKSVSDIVTGACPSGVSPLSAFREKTEQYGKLSAYEMLAALSCGFMASQDAERMAENFANGNISVAVRTSADGCMTSAEFTSVVPSACGAFVITPGNAPAQDYDGLVPEEKVYLNLPVPEEESMRYRNCEIYYDALSGKYAMELTYNIYSRIVYDEKTDVSYLYSAEYFFSGKTEKSYPTLSMKRKDCTDYEAVSAALDFYGTEGNRVCVYLYENDARGRLLTLSESDAERIKKLICEEYANVNYFERNASKRKEVSFFVSITSGEYTAMGENADFISQTKHNFAEISVDGENVPCGGEIKQIFECTDCGEQYTRYGIKDHSDEYVEEYEFAGSHNCEKGVTVKYLCRDCGEEIKRYYTENHVPVSDYRNSCGSETCGGHTVISYSCPCGKDKFSSVYETDAEGIFREVEYAYSESGYDGEYHYGIFYYACPECGFLVQKTVKTYVSNGKEIKQTQLITGIGEYKNGKCVFRRQTGSFTYVRERYTA